MDAVSSVASKTAEFAFHAYLHQIEVWKESGLKTDLEAARICLGIARRLDPGMIFILSR
jgi:hypothetical protein